jgi:uncharacterized protein YraI
VRQLLATFTPTTLAQAQPSATDTPAPSPITPVAPATTTNTLTETTSITGVNVTTGSTSVTNTAGVTTTAPVTAAPAARLTIIEDLVNVRLGPGTDYGLAGETTSGQSFDVIGKNQQGDWWQICCVNGQQVWVFGQLTRAENAENVSVVTDLPPKPVAQAPAAPQPAPAEPQPAPEEAEPAPEESAPPAADPCANIDEDGCKFKLTGGPSFQPNGGTELKLQFFFIHSGDGGRPQGSYFVAMFKDGQSLNIGNGTRSQIDMRQQGALGPYNYEYKVGLGDIPGNNVAGAYTLYVVDGNG